MEDPLIEHTKKDLLLQVFFICNMQNCSFARVIAMRGHYVWTVVLDGPCPAFIIAERTVREAGPYKHTFSYIAMNVMHTDSDEQFDQEGQCAILYLVTLPCL